MNPTASTIEVLPLLENNFAYLIHAPGGTILVDAPEAGPIRARTGKKISHILITHDDPDHVDGLAELRTIYAPEIIAPQSSRVADANRFVSGGETLTVAGLRVEVIWTPGHCAAHAAFYFPEIAAVFTGDSIFGAGCGRLFGNPPELMFASLRRLVALPDETRIYFGHEYTAANLRFAATVEPDNADVAKRAASLRAGIPTSPSTIALEKATNPFVRSRDVAEFAARRRLKDSF